MFTHANGQNLLRGTPCYATLSTKNSYSEIITFY